MIECRSDLFNNFSFAENASKADSRFKISQHDGRILFVVGDQAVAPILFHVDFTVQDKNTDLANRNVGAGFDQNDIAARIIRLHAVIADGDSKISVQGFRSGLYTFLLRFGKAFGAVFLDVPTCLKTFSASCVARSAAS